MELPRVGAFTENGGPDTGIPFKIWPEVTKITQIREIWGWCSISGVWAVLGGNLWLNIEIGVFVLRCPAG